MPRHRVASRAQSRWHDRSSIIEGHYGVPRIAQRAGCVHQRRSHSMGAARGHGGPRPVADPRGLQARGPLSEGRDHRSYCRARRDATRGVPRGLAVQSAAVSRDRPHHPGGLSERRDVQRLYVRRTRGRSALRHALGHHQCRDGVQHPVPHQPCVGDVRRRRAARVAARTVDARPADYLHAGSARDWDARSGRASRRLPGEPRSQCERASCI